MSLFFDVSASDPTDTVRQYFQRLLQLQVRQVHATICSGGVNGHRLCTKDDGSTCQGLRARTLVSAVKYISLAY